MPDFSSDNKVCCRTMAGRCLVVTGNKIDCVGRNKGNQELCLEVIEVIFVNLRAKSD